MQKIFDHQFEKNMKTSFIFFVVLVALAVAEVEISNKLNNEIKKGNTKFDINIHMKNKVNLKELGLQGYDSDTKANIIVNTVSNSFKSISSSN